MPIVSTSIPNLVNGVSQQPSALRMSSQCEEQVNAFPSVVEGLIKRPPTQYVAKVASGTLGAAHVHTINRDVSERYKVIITDGDLQVFDLDGAEKTVTFPSGKTYLSATDPTSNFRTVTIADYTFIVNNTVTCAMDVTTSADNTGQALVFIKQANYETDYNIDIDGVNRATYSTGSSGALKTTTIASDLASDLTTNLGAGWTITREGSVIHIVKDDATDFECKISDSRSNTQMRVATDKVQRFSDLPTIAPTGYTVEIIGDNTSNFDNYFVSFKPNNDSATFDEGVWEETVKPGIEYMLDASTLPHALIRESSGDFKFEPITWGDRIAGDTDSAPDPSFIGSKIADVFFEDNRLSFLADDNVIQSRAANFFEFFPSTVTTVVESDPVDTSASHTKVSILRHAVPFNEDTLLFSDQTQFKLEKNDATGLKEVKVLTEFESAIKVKPVGAGRTVYFATDKGSYTGMREYFSEGDGATNDAADITAHVPKYLPANVFKLAVATNEDVMMCLSTDFKNRVYVYKYYWSGNDKLQSAWNYFQFSDNAEVLNVDFIETDAYFLVQYPDGAYLEKMGVEPGRTDPYAEFEYLLDRKVSNADAGVSVAYDAGADETTWTLPYEADAEMQVAVRHYTTPETSTVPSGTKLQSTYSTNTVTVTGDHSTTPVFIGQKYVKRYRFSTPSLQEAAEGGGKAIVTEGRLQIKFWNIQYDGTGYFTVEVTPEQRDTMTYKYTGKTLGATSVLGAVNLSDGSFKVPVMSRSDRFMLEVKNDSFLPSRLIAAGWEGRYTLRSKRL